MKNSAMTGVNVMYSNDEGGWTSTSLEGEKIAKQMKETTNLDETKLAERLIKKNG